MDQGPPISYDVIRRNLVYGFSSLYAGSLIFILILLAVGRVSVSDTVSLLETASAVLGGLVGAVVGFYFSKSGN